MSAEDLHRLETSRPLWTIVLTGPKRRRWGFQTAAGWRYWREALDSWDTPPGAV